MATTTRWDIEREIVETYRLGRSGFNDEATGTVSIVSDDSQFGAHRGAEDIEVGCDIKVKQDTMVGGGGTVTYASSRVSIRPTFAAGTITVDPAFTGLTETPDFDLNDTDILALFLPFRFEEMDYEIDKVLGEQVMWQKLIVPLTMVRDGDMRDSDSSPTSAWTAVNSTLSKTSATFSNFGLRSLLVIDSGSGGGYAHSGGGVGTLLKVEASESYYFEATGQIGAAASTGTLVLRDTTNNENITLTESAITRFDPEILRNNVTIPSGALSVQVRLTSDGLSDTVDWSNVILRRNSQLNFVLEDKPYRIEDIGHVRSTNRSDWGRRVFANMREEAREAVQLTEGLWQIQLRRSVSGRAVFFEEWVAPGVLAADGTTTIAIKTEVAALVAERLLRGQPGYEQEYARAVVDASAVRLRAQDQRSYVESGTTVQQQLRV